MSSLIKEVTESLKGLGALGEEAKDLRVHIDRSVQQGREKIGQVKQRIVEFDDAVKSLDAFLIDSPGGNSERGSSD